MIVSNTLWNFLPTVLAYLNVATILLVRGNAGGFDEWVKTVVIPSCLSGPINFWILHQFKRSKSLSVDQQAQTIISIIPSYLFTVISLTVLIHPLNWTFLFRTLIVSIGYIFTFFALVGINPLWTNRKFLLSGLSSASFFIVQISTVLIFRHWRIENVATFSSLLGGAAYFSVASAFSRVTISTRSLTIPKIRFSTILSPLKNPTAWVVERSAIDQHFVIHFFSQGTSTYFYVASRIITTSWNWFSAFRIPLVFSREPRFNPKLFFLRDWLIFSAGIAALLSWAVKLTHLFGAHSDIAALILVFYAVTTMSSIAIGSIGKDRAYISLFNRIWYFDIALRLGSFHLSNPSLYVYGTISLVTLQWLLFWASLHSRRSIDDIVKSARSLTIFIFHPTILFNGREHVKPHHGKFIDAISQSFREVKLVAPFWRPHQFPQWLRPENPIYNYRIQSNRVRYIKGFSSKLTYPFRSFQYLFHALVSDIVLFFTPSIGSICLTPILRFMHKPYICYVAIDPAKFYSDRFKQRWLAKTVTHLQIETIRKSHGIMATGAKNLAYWKGHPNLERVSPLLDLKLEAPDDSSNLSKEPFEFLYVGLLNQRKRVHILIDCIIKLREQGIPAQLKLVGSYSEEAFPLPAELHYYESLLDKVRNAKMEPYIQFVGYVSDAEQLKSLYKRAQYLVLLSQFEGFPKVVYEAMAFGTIPVLSRLDSYDGILEDKVNALFIDDPMVDRFVSTIQSIDDRQIDAIRRANAKFLNEVLSVSPADQFLKMIQHSLPL